MPCADDARPGEWIDIAGVSANHGEILIIANHTVPVAPGTVPWDRWMGYTILNPERSPDGRIEIFVVDQYAPAYESGFTPERAREDALVIHTREDSAHTVEARTCTDPQHPGWCEIRIRLHEHTPARADPDEPAGASESVTGGELRELTNEPPHSHMA